jgi:hypothetical protein
MVAIQQESAICQGAAMKKILLLCMLAIIASTPAYAFDYIKLMTVATGNLMIHELGHVSAGQEAGLKCNLSFIDREGGNYYFATTKWTRPPGVVPKYHLPVVMRAFEMQQYLVEYGIANGDKMLAVYSAISPALYAIYDQIYLGGGDAVSDPTTISDLSGLDRSIVAGYFIGAAALNLSRIYFDCPIRPWICTANHRASVGISFDF